jgi:3',5'-cyclic AMP phosphodiesterase CpdA
VKWLEPVLLAFLLASSGFNSAFQIVACIFLFVAFYLIPSIYIKPAAWIVLVTVNLWSFSAVVAVLVGLTAGILRACILIGYYVLLRKESVPFLTLSWSSLTFPLTVSLVGVLFLVNTGHRTDDFRIQQDIEAWKEAEPKRIEKENNNRIQKQELRIVERFTITSLHPCSGSRVSDAVQNNIFEGLMTLDGNRLRDGVSHNVKVSPDKLTYTFSLKPNAKWSDGKPVTAYDFQYGWDQITGIEEEYKALDSKTFEVKLKKANPDYLRETASGCLFPLREDQAKKHGDKYLSQAEFGSYNGAFYPSGSNPLGAILKPNPHYWDKDKVKLQSVFIDVDQNRNEDISMYERGEHEREVNYIQEKKHLDKYKGNSELHLLSNKKHGYLVQPYVKNMTFDRYDRYYLKYAHLQIKEE